MARARPSSAGKVTVFSVAPSATPNRAAAYGQATSRAAPLKRRQHDQGSVLLIRPELVAATDVYGDCKSATSKDGSRLRLVEAG